MCACFPCVHMHEKRVTCMCMRRRDGRRRETDSFERYVDEKEKWGMRREGKGEWVGLGEEE